MANLNRKETLDNARKSQKKLKILIEDIRIVLRDSKKTDREKLNTIYSLLDNY